MAQPDWCRGDLTHELQVQMVDPFNLTTIRGYLNYTKVSGTLDLDYYSDTRMSAKIETFVEGKKDNWDGSAALRLIHVVSDYTGELYRETLGTFYVMDPPESSEETGGTTTSYTLSSILKGIEVSMMAYGKTINKSASILAATKKMVTDCYRRVRDAGARDVKASAAIKYDQGASYLHGIHDSANRCNNHVTLDPDGTVVIEPYNAPSNRSPNFYVTAEDERTLFVGPWSHSDNTVTMPERHIVSGSGKVKVADGTYSKAGTRSDGTTYKKGDTKYKEVTKTITGVAQVATGSRSHHNVRGFWRDGYTNVSNMSPFTQAKADSLAKQYLNNNLVYEMKASHSLMYRPLREGWVECLTIHDDTRRWQIASASLNFDTWTWNLDLKGGWK